MDSNLLHAFLAWIEGHAAWIPPAALAIAFLESLALVGLIMPGALLLFGLGALVGFGAAPFLQVALWAAIGALLGDGVSYWLGRRFRHRLPTLKPLRNHPELIPRATRFFHRHGGKGILFGRFVGPLRPILPAVAGMLEMPAWRFLLVDGIGALLWAPAYLLPGVAFGLSLDLAAEVAARLALLIVLVGALFALAAWSMVVAFRLIHPHTHALLTRWLAWSRDHPVAGQLPAAILDPGHPEAKGLTLTALLLVTAALTFLVILNLWAHGRLVELDLFVYRQLELLQTPLADRLFMVVAQLGSLPVLGLLVTLLGLWLVLHRRWRALAHWLAAAAFAVALTETLRLAGGLFPVVHYDSPFQGFPSRAVTHGTVVYGFLAVLIAREAPPATRPATYATVAVVLTAIALAHLFLGIDGLTSVVGGVAFGLVWVGLLGIAYRRHPAGELPLAGLISASLLTLMLAGGWEASRQWQREPMRPFPAPVAMVDEGGWWNGGWRRLPAERKDLRGARTERFSIQYGGDLGRLQERLLARGWIRPKRLDGGSWLLWLGRHPLAELPLLPQLHSGRHETLLLVRPVAGDPERLLALRLWWGETLLTPERLPVWVGTVQWIHADHRIPGLTLPLTLREAAVPTLLVPDLSGLKWRLDQGDDGPLLLILASKREHL